MHITVLIPTYLRPADLLRCLDALSRQQRPADQILVVRRTEDLESQTAVDQWTSTLPLKVVCVDLPGQVHSLNTGLEHVTGDIVSIIDDDTAPHPGWLQRIEEIFAAEPDVGGVGGRDHVYIDGKLQSGSTSTVGTILWYGKFAGNHPIGAPPKRDVLHLKGANMSYRMAAVGDTRFDRRMRGRGAQVRNDLAFSLAIHNKGWRNIFDPLVAVDHFTAQRLDSDKRGAPDIEAAENMAFNHFLVIEDYVQPAARRLMARLYVHIVGLRHIPGILRAIIYRLRSNRQGLAYRAAALRAWHDVRKLP